MAFTGGPQQIRHLLDFKGLQHFLSIDIYADLNMESLFMKTKVDVTVEITDLCTIYNMLESQNVGFRTAHKILVYIYIVNRIFTKNIFNHKKPGYTSHKKLHCLSFESVLKLSLKTQ